MVRGGPVVPAVKRVQSTSLRWRAPFNQPLGESHLDRIRTLLVVCALALPIPAAIAGCGSDDSSSSEDPQTVLDETFNNDTKVTSGDLKLNASLSAEGDQGGQFQAEPQRSVPGGRERRERDPAARPRRLSANGSGGGQSIDFSGGLVVTDDNAYVEYKDQAYEVGTKAFSQIKRQMEAQAGQSSSATGGFKEGCTQALQQAGATRHVRL